MSLVPDALSAAWPSFRDEVEIRGAWADGWFVSRVEGGEPSELLLATPFGENGRPIAVRAGEPVVLRWNTEHGFGQVEGTVVAAEGGLAPKWHVQPAAEPTLQQRRDYVRARLDLPVLVHTEGATPARGRIVDLSEGGTRIELDAESPQARASDVVLDVKTPGLVLMWVQATVARRLERSLDGRLIVGYRFVNLPDAAADAIRMFVIRTEFRRRASAEDE